MKFYHFTRESHALDIVVNGFHKGTNEEKMVESGLSREHAEVILGQQLQDVVSWGVPGHLLPWAGMVGTAMIAHAYEQRKWGLEPKIVAIEIEAPDGTWRVQPSGATYGNLQFGAAPEVLIDRTVANGLPKRIVGAITALEAPMVEVNVPSLWDLHRDLVKKYGIRRLMGAAGGLFLHSFKTSYKATGGDVFAFKLIAKDTNQDEWGTDPKILVKMVLDSMPLGFQKGMILGALAKINVNLKE